MSSALAEHVSPDRNQRDIAITGRRIAFPIDETETQDGCGVSSHLDKPRSNIGCGRTHLTKCRCYKSVPDIGADILQSSTQKRRALPCTRRARSYARPPRRSVTILSEIEMKQQHWLAAAPLPGVATSHEVSFVHDHALQLFMWKRLGHPVCHLETRCTNHPASQLHQCKNTLTSRLHLLQETNHVQASFLRDKS
eukprot:4865926-Amphidinium_carterae.1